MIKKLKKFLLKGVKLAEYYEENGEFDDAYKEYLKIGSHKEAGAILEKTEKWHQAANLYITHNENDLARKAIDNCFRRNDGWEVFEPDNGQTILIENWLKRKRQVRRFVRYVKHVETLDKKGVPLIIALANKLKQVLEYKSAGELYRHGFDLVNKENDFKNIKNEVWIKYAAECYSRAKLYNEAAQCMRDLIVTEVKIGDALSQYDRNPYRDYTYNLKTARDLHVLELLIKLMDDFDPFNISYDLWKIGQPELSIGLFFKYYGRILREDKSDKEMEVRNKKIQYCLNQYVIYYSQKKDYAKAAEVALLNSQKEIASDLFKKAEELKKMARKASDLVVENVKTEELGASKGGVIVSGNGETSMTLQCSTCGEFVAPDWEICPNCGNVLDLQVCVCGQKVKPQWKKCPACQRILEHAKGPDQKVEIRKAAPGEPLDDDTKPFKLYND